MPDMPHSPRARPPRAARRPASRSCAVLASIVLASCVASCGKRPSPQRTRPAPAPTSDAAATDYDRHLAALRKRAPEGFTIVVQKPFVVIGDEREETVRRRAATVVKWSADVLQAEYFDKPPARITDIWLFRDAHSYQDNALALFGKKPTTPYGWYSEQDDALIMNIATGGGTLVHEVVHAYMRSNFPGCPVWFNEGLGSLYEQSEDAGGRPRGLLNWRLPGLQQAIDERRVPTLHELASMDDDGFYGEGSGVHYAQARYLLYYLQERELLRPLWKELRASHGSDPTGWATLQRVLGEADMTAFETRWHNWVMGLRWEG